MVPNNSRVVGHTAATAATAVLGSVCALAGWDYEFHAGVLLYISMSNGLCQFACGQDSSLRSSPTYYSRTEPF